MGATEDAAEDAKDAYDDIKELDFSISLVKPGESGTFDPVTGWTGGTVDEDHQTYGMRKEYDLKNIDGTTIERGDSMIMFSAHLLPVIDSEYKIKIDGTDVEIIDLDIFAPANIPILYTAQVRGV